MLRRGSHIRHKGWHRDPTGRHEFREWDGERWTEHVCDQGLASIDPVPVRSLNRKPERSRGGLGWLRPRLLRAR